VVRFSGVFHDYCEPATDGGSTNVSHSGHSGSPPDAVASMAHFAEAFSVSRGQCFRLVHNGAGHAQHCREPVVRPGVFVAGQACGGPLMPAPSTPSYLSDAPPVVTPGT
jgi:hypothetical protein